jgi:hypothetical protein
MGACGPNLPLRQVGSYIEKARDAGMVMLYMDTMMEYWITLPYIYTEHVMAKARQILEEAAVMADATNEISRRISFLMDGLEWVQKAADYMGAKETDKEESLSILAEFNESMPEKYGYWNTKDIHMMKYWGIIGEDYDLRGM